METNFLDIELDDCKTAETTTTTTLNRVQSDDIPILSSSLTYEYFFKHFMLRNVPCIIKNVANEWDATMSWISDDKPDFTCLKSRYGHCEITVYDCNTRYFNSNEITKCKFSEYLEYWQNAAKQSVTAHKKELKYLKDWHLKQQCPHDDFYQVPKFFASDWLNEYLIENQREDYRFVYMGPEHTWTPFHADVFMSYSWSVNVCGKKKWILLPPGEENKLRASSKSFHFDISDRLDNVLHYVVIQNSGEAMFVPSGWYHQVWNLADTISINHNWFNGCNIDIIWETLSHNLDLVKKEIEDCKDADDFVGECQKVLNLSHGMNFYVFFDLLKYIAMKRISVVKGETCYMMYNGYSFSKNHAVYDIRKCASVLKELVAHEDFDELDFQTSPGPKELLHLICRILESVSS